MPKAQSHSGMACPGCRPVQVRITVVPKEQSQSLSMVVPKEQSHTMFRERLIPSIRRCDGKQPTVPGL